MTGCATNLYDEHVALTQQSYYNSAGVSKASEHVEENLREVTLHQVSSASGDRLMQLQGELYELWEEAGAPNWDNDGGAPVTLPAVLDAMHFMRELPLTYITMPTLGVDRKGCITLDWENAHHDSVTVIVRGKRLIFAALYGDGDEAHGISGFVNRIPELIIRHIESIGKNERLSP